MSGPNPGVESAATGGIGTKLQRGQGTTPETYEDVAEVLDLKLDGISVMVRERTHMQSPGGAVEKVGILYDGGSIVAQCHFRPDDDTQSVLWADAKTIPQEPRNWRVVFAPEDDPIAQLDFKALVEKLPVVTDHKDLQKMTLSLAVSGPVTLT